MTGADTSGAAPSGADPSGSAGPAAHAARVLLAALADLGVRAVVLAPGSRSAPLAAALVDASLPDDARPEGAPALDLHVRVDERVAGFLALGLARASGAPVAVVTTSGTAVANLHPAVLEAHHAGVPLLLLTADRPHELRGTGANQTTEQVGLFAGAVRLAVDVPAPTGRPGEDGDLRAVAVRAVTAATGARTGTPGPVHLDLAYREPLLPVVGSPWPPPRPAARVVPAAPGAGPDLPLPDDRPTVVVAGDGAGGVAAALGRARGWPVLAEPSSGARTASAGPAAYRLLLEHPALGGRVRRAVVLGRPTLSRPVQRLLGRPDVETVVVALGGAPWPDAARAADLVLPGVPPAWLEPGRDEPPTSPWSAAWTEAGRRADAAVDAVLAAGRGADAPATRALPPLTGPEVARAVAAASAPQDVLVVGSSNPVRDLDLLARWDAPPLVLANRGLAGIDGTLSTAVGVALALPRRRVRVLVGDLTFLHDVGGLLVGTLERDVDLQVVVADDDGGSIFHTLEPGEPERAAGFERVFGTPQGADLAALCAGLGVRHTRVSHPDALAAALAAPGTGRSVVQVRVDRTDRRGLGERLRVAVLRALDGPWS
ncbi:2-succinyl-5-enolpyruvyl-6-hydroxy-3-cyclohexene-1-carboxylic-acid synthase [Cellulomonas endophytica]|uniref:2-succinyl-5-enolpyruvyl-6-hydroxy-3- cyclohexene-1-carboxylic-acid synthase n=1 Tax=Cellulomonas endophytica TaxID=2494735 RepID=UPI0010134CCE|nr:2-succinyl-5-enolpyruvyl-6-hydroxy-3-cyclohexene-1-carboxylic-acid synthase [Cellulomonas endophytica]